MLGAILIKIWASRTNVISQLYVLLCTHNVPIYELLSYTLSGGAMAMVLQISSRAQSCSHSPAFNLPAYPTLINFHANHHWLRLASFYLSSQSNLTQKEVLKKFIPQSQMSCLCRENSSTAFRVVWESFISFSVPFFDRRRELLASSRFSAYLFSTKLSH